MSEAIHVNVPPTVPKPCNAPKSRRNSFGGRCRNWRGVATDSPPRTFRGLAAPHPGRNANQRPRKAADLQFCGADDGIRTRDPHLGNVPVSVHSVTARTFTCRSVRTNIHRAVFRPCSSGALYYEARSPRGTARVCHEARRYYAPQARTGERSAVRRAPNPRTAPLHQAKAIYQLPHIAARVRVVRRSIAFVLRVQANRAVLGVFVPKAQGFEGLARQDLVAPQECSRHALSIPSFEMGCLVCEVKDEPQLDAWVGQGDADFVGRCFVECSGDIGVLVLIEDTPHLIVCTTASAPLFQLVRTLRIDCAVDEWEWRAVE